MKPRHNRWTESSGHSVVVFISKRRKQEGRDRKVEIVADVSSGMECIAKRRGKRPPSLNPDVVFTAKPMAPRIRRCREADLERQRFFSSPMAMGEGEAVKPSPTTVFHPFVLDFGNDLIDGFIAQSPHHRHDDEMVQAATGSEKQPDSQDGTKFAPIWSLHISLSQLQQGHNGATVGRKPSDSKSMLQPTALDEWKNILKSSKKDLVRSAETSLSLKSAKIQEVCAEGDDICDLQQLFQQKMHVVVEADDLSELQERFSQHMRVNPHSQLACRFG